MQLHNEFIVSTDPERAWRLLTDLANVANCLPGAQLLGVEGEDYKGSVQVKVGPIRAKFAGTASFQQRDDDQRMAVIAAAGKDQRGQAAADALISAQVLPDGEFSRVVVDTDLTISGRLAQFGRGAVADVSARLMTQFAENLNTMMSAEDPPPTVNGGTTAPASTRSAPTGTSPASSVPAAPAAWAAGVEPAVSSLNAAELIGPVVLRRYGPYAVVVVLTALITRALCGGRPRPVARRCDCR